MQPRILTTDGGPHSAATWANLTADMLMPIDDPHDPPISAERRPVALRLQAAIAEALTPHHAAVQVTERSGLAEDGHARLATPHDAHEARMDQIIADIRAAAAGTPWEAHFADPVREDAIRGLVASHLIEVQKIERQWHCDRAEDKNHPRVEARRAALVGTVMPTEG